MIQVCVIKISGYGPWTLTLGSDREHRLQMLQASLYGRIQQAFSDRGCLAFYNRADEFFAVTNGMDAAAHGQVRDSLCEGLQVRLSVSIGCAATPFGANEAAHAARASGDDSEAPGIFGRAGGGDEATIMHLDVDGLTASQKAQSPYEITAGIFGLYASMSKFFMEKKSLAFFMGGDNFMVAAGPGYKESAAQFIEIAKKDHGVLLNCGIGTAGASREAARLATKSLDAIREIRDSGGAKPEIYELP